MLEERYQATIDARNRKVFTIVGRLSVVVAAAYGLNLKFVNGRLTLTLLPHKFPFAKILIVSCLETVLNCAKDVSIRKNGIAEGFVALLKNVLLLWK